MNRQMPRKLGVVASGILGLTLGLLPHVVSAQTSSMVVTETGNVGIGVDAPARQLHLRGTNSTFRMDRDKDTAAFIISRTAPGAFTTPWKTFVVGVNASGLSTGEFVINDLGSAVSGGGVRRLTITNEGNVILTGTLTQSSSLRYKSGVETFPGADQALSNLRGVKYVRSSSGREDVGLVAEEVAQVLPQLVERNPVSGEAEAVNYSAMVAVLIEGYKHQSKVLAAQRDELASLKQRLIMLEAAQRSTDPGSMLIVKAP